MGCAYGISNIGYVMICFGVFNALAAPIAGALVKLTGRYPVMCTALVSLNVSLIKAFGLRITRSAKPFIFGTKTMRMFKVYNLLI